MGRLITDKSSGGSRLHVDATAFNTRSTVSKELYPIREQWRTVAMAISALLNAGLLYLIVYFTFRQLAPLLGSRSAKLNGRGTE
jgi:hypothetical protein